MLDFLFISHIALNGERIAARGFDRSNDLCRGVGIALVIHRNIVAACGGEARSRGTDATASAGDKKDRTRHASLRLIYLRPERLRRLRRASTLKVSTAAAKAMAE